MDEQAKQDAPEPDASGPDASGSDASRQENQIILHARIFRSPFAITAAAVIAGQAAVLIVAAGAGRQDMIQSGLPLLVAALAMLTVGAAPCWNFLRVTRDGFEQHAGLTVLRSDWAKVQSVRPRVAGAEIRHVISLDADARRVRQEFLLNRYGVTADAFGELVEGRWRAVRCPDF